MNESDYSFDPSSKFTMKTNPAGVFLIAGLTFLIAALSMLLIAAYILRELSMEPKDIGGNSQEMLGRVMSVFLAPFMILLSGAICSYVGIRLLKAAGIVTKRVIPVEDYHLLSSAIEKGNEKAISEYIRLSSLSSVTGTFTRMGLTGLPLATILLTIFLSLLGYYNQKFLDLAQLTLGAFIGSYVQKQQEPNKL